MISLLTKKQQKNIFHKVKFFLSEYAEKIESNVKSKYIENIFEAGIDPVLIPPQ